MISAEKLDVHSFYRVPVIRDQRIKLSILSTGPFEPGFMLPNWNCNVTVDNYEVKLMQHSYSQIEVDMRVNKGERSVLLLAAQSRMNLFQSSNKII